MAALVAYLGCRVCPRAWLVHVVRTVAEGVRNSARGSIDDSTLRVRSPRVIGPDHLIRPFNVDQADILAVVHHLAPDAVGARTARLPRPPAFV